jgi:wyosine [tRNA(Phe)-imidazoG37] synthetase (radical SAM superfamily)
MSCVFGPVPSWRLGRSLGVDPVPLKTCNWNCVYCQLGRTRPLVHERCDGVPVDTVRRELREALVVHAPGEVDWVTFVGSGEPLLHSRFGDLLRAAKAMSDLPVALITNGSLFCRPEVRSEVASSDAVLPTLDAGTPELYRRINRPHPALGFDRHLEGLVALRDEYPGRIWLEVMLIEDANDTDAALESLASCIAWIRPNEVHLNVPTRPPVERWVRAPDRERVLHAAALLGRIVPVRVAPPVRGDFVLDRSEDLVEAVAAILERHPMTERQLLQALEHRAPGRVGEALAQLERSGRVQTVVRDGTVFRVSAGSWFPDAG